MDEPDDPDGWPWLGLSTPRREDVLCVELYQSAPQNEQSYAAAELRLDRLDGGAWAVARLFDGPLVGGSVERLPVLSVLTRYRTPSDAWRVTNESPTLVSWKLPEVAFFSDIGCSEPVDGEVVASGWGAGSHPPQNARDGDVETTWWSECFGCTRRQVPELNTASLGLLGGGSSGMEGSNS